MLLGNLCHGRNAKQKTRFGLSELDGVNYNLDHHQSGDQHRRSQFKNRDRSDYRFDTHK